MFLYGGLMARIIENLRGRRIIEISPDDVINIVREYQNIVRTQLSYAELREVLCKMNLCIPEDI